MRRLQKKIREQDQAINDLKQGEHDIELEGGSQDDMEDLFEKCNADPSLAASIKENDSTGVLLYFGRSKDDVCPIQMGADSSASDGIP